MDPIFKINGHDYTQYIATDGIKPVINDIDADGSGRNYLDDLMYRRRTSRKDKRTISFLRLNAKIMMQLLADMDADYVSITLLFPQTDTQMERVYYCSTINCGIQRKMGGGTVYDGVTFNITER